MINKIIWKTCYSRQIIQFAATEKTAEISQLHHLHEEETKKLTLKKIKEGEEIKTLIISCECRKKKCSSLASGTVLTKLGIESKAKET